MSLQEAQQQQQKAATADAAATASAAASEPNQTMATAESVAVLAQEIENMKTVLNSKIGANGDIMVSVTYQLGSLTRQLGDFCLMPK